jgi:hypothetical protein
MGLSSLLSSAAGSAGAALRKVPGLKQVANYGDDYVATGNKKSLAKVMTPFAVGAAIPVAMAAAPAGGLSSLAAGASRLGTSASKVGKTSLSKLSQSPAAKTTGKVAVGTAATGAAGYGAVTGYKALTGGGNVDKTGEIIQKQTTPDPDPAEPGYDGGSGGGTTREQKERAKLIGAGWDDMEDELSNTTKMVSDYAGELDGRLGDLRKSYLSAIDESERQDNEAIGGQKTLVDKERNTELGKVAADARKGFFQANTRYGGPKGSSAGMMAQKGVQGMAEKSRKEVLDEVGVMLSELGQKEQEVKVVSERQRKDVYDMEKQLKDEAMAEFNDSMKALKRLTEKKKGWKQKDLDSQSDSYLAKLANSIATISAQAKARRDQIHSAEYEIGNQIKDLRQKAALTFAPPELEADKIDLGEAINPGQSEEDFFNPNAEERKRISSKVKNILDELDQEDAATAA